MILRRRCRLALSNHVGHCTLMTKAVLDFTPSLIINLLQFGIDVALLFQQALDVANSALGLRPSAFVIPGTGTPWRKLTGATWLCRPDLDKRLAIALQLRPP